MLRTKLITAKPLICGSLGLYHQALTQPLEKSWHVLGLGYNPAIEDTDIESAAVIHWNGNMKPWLEIAISKFKPH
nr:hypothetical protein PHYPA_015147 [Physcomitrium patens]